MTASYPGGIRTWTTKLGWRNIVWASHVNDLQTEVDATQRTLGLNPHISRNNPGGLTRNYGTVEQRMTSHARGEDLLYYRGQVKNFVPAPGEWVDVPITVGDAVLSDPFLLSTPAGVRLNSTGMWMIEARTEWQASGYSVVNQARRMLRVLVNGADVGMSHLLYEDARNSFALHNAVTWPEIWPLGTVIRVQVRADIEPSPTTTPPADPLPGKVWCRRRAPWKLLRCWNGAEWEPFTGTQDTTISSPTAPSSGTGKLWIDTSGDEPVVKVYTSGSWREFTGWSEITTVHDGAAAPTPTQAGQVWVDTMATANLVQAYLEGAWKPLCGRDVEDGGGNPAPVPTPTPNYGLKVNVSLRLHQMRSLDAVPPTGTVRAPRDVLTP
ncbi:hypothetical protein [Microbispora sp. NPDC049633]|uniref:hypothetical protein n=1 Tax=Microbispora sp. NPDC049633 TaxID=3154355 RepID=UPI00342CC91F